MEKLMDASDLAEVLGMSRTTIIKNCTLFPDRLPPSLKIGSLHGARRWRPETVRDWLRDQEERMTRLRGAPLQVNPAGWKEKQGRRRGRPTKAESVAKKHEEAFPSGHKTQPLPWGGTS
jgi:predicted DNA-binding transcriptional regulator AlpA